MKQFKKKSSKISNDTVNENHNGRLNVHDEYLNQIYSGRSTPSSTFSSVSSPGVILDNNNTYKPQIENQSPVLSSDQPPFQNSFPNMNFHDANHLTPSQVKEQLQLHVQTIGILVAEKAELQSKLQQQTKKSDKKQDECDELMGRLKASRQKISDLERLVQQVSNQSNIENNASIQSNNDLDRLKSELNSNQLVIDELRIRLNESNEKLQLKQQETQRLAQLTLDLKSQLEIMQLKVTQLSINNAENVTTNVEKTSDNKDDTISQELEKLREINSNLEKNLEEANKKLENKRDELKQEYQTYVEQLQRQIESLVDQINRMSDEREDAFSKLDRLESLLDKANKNNQQLTNQLNELTSTKSTTEMPEQQTNIQNTNSPKIELLENEIKYFKQQIEILLEEQVNLKQSVDEKEQTIISLNKLLENYSSERDKYNSLLDQSHNDKQTISRILQQNKELKDQLGELQDVYVNVTQKNLDLATELQSAQFKLKKISDDKSQSQISENISKTSNLEAEPNAEWGNEDGEEINHQQTDTIKKSDSLMDGLKVF